MIVYRTKINKPLDHNSPKKLAGHLSASSYDSEWSSCDERHRGSKRSKKLTNFIIQEEQDDTESKKASKHTTTEMNGIVESLNETSSYAIDATPWSIQPSESELTNELSAINIHYRFSNAVPNVPSVAKSITKSIAKSSRNDDSSSKSLGDKGGEVGFAKKRKLIKNKRQRISGVDLEEHVDPKDTQPNLDKIQPIINTKEPMIDFDIHGDSQQASKLEDHSSKYPSPQTEIEINLNSKDKVLDVEDSILEV
jgi:hypothetical protein